MASRDPYEDLLLGGRWRPLTTTIVFVEREAEAFVDWFLGWRGARIAERTGCAPVTSTVDGTLEDALAALLPLTTVEASKHLVMPTADGGCAVVENLWTGTDGQMLAGGIAANGMRAVAVSEAPHTYRSATNTGTWGIRTVTLAVPAPEGPRQMDAWTVGVRTTDSGRWEVSTPATPPPFPDPTDHSARRVADRFTHAHLLQVTEALGLRVTDPGFYLPGGRGFIIERTDPRDPSWPELTLEQAQANGRGVLS